MSSFDGHSAPGGSPSSAPADLKLEAVVIPVANAGICPRPVPDRV
jgi:hypothetical protein